MTKANTTNKVTTNKATENKATTVKATIVKAAGQKKTEKKVEKKQVEKFNFKATAESIESAFKADKSVDVIADSNRDYPKSVTYTDYSFIHFYNPGTEKDMFQLYINSKSAKFIVRNKVVEYLKGVNTSPVEKTVKGKKQIIHTIVSCPLADTTDIAKKIIAAYQSIPVVEKKVEKKQTTTKKKTEKVAK